MTIIEAIERIDASKPNACTQEEKIAWLSELDGMIKRDIIDTHEDGEEIIFDGYTDETPVGTELIVGKPYDELYVHYLEAKIDYFNAEYTRYNNSSIKFSDAYSNYAKDYNRSHMPKKKKFLYF